MNTLEKKRAANPQSINGFLGRAENYPLSKPMVDHNQKGIETIRKGKVSDQITGDLLKGAGAGGWNGEQGRSGWMCVDLVLLARGTTTDIALNIRGEAWPPILRGNKLASFENTRVTCCGVVMMASNNRMAKIGIGWDINTALVSQNASIIVPVREAQAEGSGNFIRESVEGVKD